jgi:prepilin-type N-terminal cleavage/methylation domain-containing protein
MTMPRTPNGFSLVEMLVALAVTGMAAVVLGAAIGQIGVVSRRGDEKADQLAEIAQAQTLLRQQIMRAAPRADAQSGGSAVDFVGTTTRADWIGAPLDSAGGDALWRYRLARAASATSIAEIVLAVDEPLRATRCGDKSPGCMMNGERCLTHDLWEETGRQIEAWLASVSLEDVVTGRVGPGRRAA